MGQATENTLLLTQEDDITKEIIQVRETTDIVNDRKLANTS